MTDPRSNPVPPPVWDGPALLGAVGAATDWLGANKDRVNALNVFPVPDGDTGTNMVLTMRAAVDETRAADAATRATAGGVAAKIAYGALMGARGNSGVILSQIFRGFARAVVERQEIDGRDLAAALDGAREMAYKAVMRPVEGTMLTVIRGAAERAEAVARRTPSLPTVLGEAVRGAREALATTPDLLEILRQAGVVDAGGQGVVHILEGMQRFARGESVTVTVTGSESDVAVGHDMAFLDRVEELHGDDAFGYCTNFMVFGEGIPFDRVRAELAEMGQSAVIVGDETVLKVHIHVLNPGQVLDYALGFGSLGQIKIDNMQSQTRALTAQRQESEPVATPVAIEPPVAATGQSVLAVAAGPGLAEVLRTMGAAGVVEGGQTMNPSIQQLRDAVEATPANEVILLPNNPNIILTANQVPALTSKQVRVVPSRSIPQGVAALAAHNAGAGLDANVAAMTEAIAGVRTVELTTAVRDARINGVTVAAGQVIGLVDDRLVAGGDDEATVCRETLAEAGADAAELVTVFVGGDANPAHAETLRQAIAAAFPAVEVEVYDGGQPHYRYIIAVE